MSFRPNDPNVQQTSVLDAATLMSEREKKFMNRSWAKYFADYIFPNIDEQVFAKLYSDVVSRPNTPVNVIVGGLLLEQLTNQSDDDMIASMMFDLRYKVALHTTGMAEQPISDRTFGRFRERCENHRLETGEDLLHDCIVKLSAQMAEIMKIDRSLRRMDSMMISANIKRMSRLELLYHCTAKMVLYLQKAQEQIPEELHHYLDKEDENLTLYHNKTDDTSSKIDRILADDTILVKLCTGGKYDEVTEYQLLLRVLNEQTVLQEDGSYRLKEAGDPTMTGSILQNPSVPEATFRTKAGKEHRGYVANLVEEKGEDSSLVTDYQVEQNIHSDSEFMDEYIDNIGQQDEKVTVVADGAYSGKAQEEHAGDNNVEIFTTNLTGKEAKDIAADFEFNEDGTRVTRCPNGKEPKSCSCSKAGICTVSFHKSDCENCPYRDQCQPKEYARTNHVTISARAKERAEKQRSRKTEEFKKMSAFRNGVETVPSFLRRLFDVDRMPVRGKGRVSFFFGCMVGALNVRKFCNCMLGRDRSAQMATIG